MRKDVYVENDSGALSVVSGAALEAVIADERANDRGFVDRHEAILLELYGDDSVVVRVVVDEPLTLEEDTEWLACARARLDVRDGRVLIAGGFDPDTLASWLEEEGPDQDGWGVKVVPVPSGTWFADVYTHASSMNGRELLARARAELGAWFRHDHPGTPFPLWLARHLSFSAGEDPGHEALWARPENALRDPQSGIDTERRGFVGFLLHLHQNPAERAAPQDDGFLPLDAGARAIARFPLGLPSPVSDPELAALAEELTGAAPPPPPGPAPARAQVIPIFDGWAGAPLSAVPGGVVPIRVDRIIAAYLLARLASEAAPRLEVRVRSAPAWVVPPPQSDVAIERRSDEVRLGPPGSIDGWALLSAIIMTGQYLSELPDGAVLELATGAQLDDDDDGDPAIGRVWLRGEVRGGKWHVDAASPPASAETLRAALGFTEQLFLDERLTARDPAERAVVETTLEAWGSMARSPGPSWKGDVLELRGCDERLCCLIGAPLFRARFAPTWPMSPPDDD